MNTVSSVFWAGIVLEVVTFWKFCLVDSSSGSYRNQLSQSKIRLQILNLKFHQLKIYILDGGEISPKHSNQRLPKDFRNISSIGESMMPNKYDVISTEYNVISMSYNIESSVTKWREIGYIGVTIWDAGISC